MNLYLGLILVVIAGEFFLGLVIDLRNLSWLKPELPDEFAGFYDQEKYSKSQAYARDRTKFELSSGSFFTALTVVFILTGGFNLFDRFARSFGLGQVATGLVFAGSLCLALQIISLPFSAYRIFALEEKYGFNRMTVKTFFADLVKGLVIGALISGPTFALIVWFFLEAGATAWIYCWLAAAAIEIFVMFISPAIILPLFNKFEPLPDGELKTAIEEYARKEKFALQGIFRMDGSRRSSKSNAFFTGFGKFRRIALFDTLISGQTTDELVSVLAHEIGHYKRRHIIKRLFISMLTMGIMFYLLSLFINNKPLASAFKMDVVSVYSSLFFFAFLYKPVSMVISLAGNILSRRQEYEADAWAVDTYGRPAAMITALKKLSVDNLSNLTPHPWKVFWEYSHPPVLERIRALRGSSKN